MKIKFRKFHNSLIREIKKREKHYNSKSEKWKETITGDKYQYYTDMLYDLDESIRSSRSYTEFFN